MQLLTQELRKQLPPLYTYNHGWDGVAWVKFYAPNEGWTWYASEFDGTNLFYGLIIIDEPILDLFSLLELEEYAGDRGRDVVCDHSFEPATLRYLFNIYQHIA